jgi:hypothetical protein
LCRWGVASFPAGKANLDRHAVNLCQQRYAASSLCGFVV